MSSDEEDPYRILANAIITGHSMMRNGLIIVVSLIIAEALLIIWVMAENHRGQLDCISRICSGARQLQNVQIEQQQRSEFDALIKRQIEKEIGNGL